MATARATLTLVPDLPPERAGTVTFCSHCGTSLPARNSRARVCGECGLGLLLNASAEFAPDADDAFLVIDGSLAVCAVSRAAERLLGTSESGAVNRHLTIFLAPADNRESSARGLAIAVTRAVRGLPGCHQLMVRPTNTLGIRLGATVGSCGPQPAALVVLG